MRSITVKQDGHELEVSDAVAGAKGELVLATDEGLKRFVIDGDKVEEAMMKDPGRPVRCLCRDGGGRLWAGGDGLVFFDEGRKRWHWLDELPMMGRTQVSALAPNSNDRDGVMVGLRDRGFVFVSTP
jgi:ligand-binding sensor domain-containing protein